MRKQTFKFSKSATDIFFDLSITKLKEIVDVKKVIFITDENIFYLTWYCCREHRAGKL